MQQPSLDTTLGQLRRKIETEIEYGYGQARAWSAWIEHREQAMRQLYVLEAIAEEPMPLVFPKPRGRRRSELVTPAPVSAPAPAPHEEQPPVLELVQDSEPQQDQGIALLPSCEHHNLTARGAMVGGYQHFDCRDCGGQDVQRRPIAWDQARLTRGEVAQRSQRDRERREQDASKEGV